MLFEIVNLSDPVTIEADDEKVAMAAVLMLGEGNYGLRAEDGRLVMPVLLLLNEAQLDAWMVENLGFAVVGLSDFAEAHIAQIVACYETALVGDLQTRRSIIAALKAGGGDFAKARDTWNDEQRSSMNDICGACFRRAAHLRKTFMKTEAAASA